jgi:hypothetical protein
MASWFRFYAEALDDPKVQKLDPATFKYWVNILCLACKHDGFLPSEDDIGFALRIDDIGVRSLLDRLVIGGLIDVVRGGPNGSRIAPHGWQKRQYKSDTSTERVKRFRNRSTTVSETGPETETETEVSVAKATAADAAFDPAKLMFDSGVLLLKAAGKTESSARAWLGKKKGAYGTEAVISAIGAAKREGAPDPIAYMEATLRKSAAASAGEVW